MNKNIKLLLLSGIIAIVFCFGIFIESTFNILENKEPEKIVFNDTIIDLTQDIGVILELQRQGILDSAGYIKFGSFEIEDGRYFLEVKKVEH
ncbi:MAG TPA: hypothetical protein VIL99_16300 [Ignavibacteria bacterium]